jgi:Phasin protein
MAEEQATERAAVKAAEHDEPETEREQSADRTGQRESRRQEKGRTRGDGPTPARQVELMAAASYDDLVELNRAGMNATLKAGQAMLKATSSLAEEVAGFACQRLRTDVETARSLMESGNDWNKAIELQGKFAADATRDYLEEMTKIAQLSAQATREVWTSWQGFSTRLAGGDAARPS